MLNNIFYTTLLLVHILITDVSLAKSLLEEIDINDNQSIKYLYLAGANAYGLYKKSF